MGSMVMALVTVSVLVFVELLPFKLPLAPSMSWFRLPLPVNVKVPVSIDSTHDPEHVRLFANTLLAESVTDALPRSTSVAALLGITPPAQLVPVSQSPDELPTHVIDDPLALKLSGSPDVNNKLVPSTAGTRL